MCTHTYINTSIHTHIHAYIHTYTYSHTYIHIYTHIFTYITSYTLGQIQGFFMRGKRTFSAFNSVLLTYLSPPAATGCRPPLKCGDTSSQLVPSCCTESANQREGKQRVVILLNWLIVNCLDTRGYYSRTTFWRGECRYIEWEAYGGAIVTIFLRGRKFYVKKVMILTRQRGGRRTQTQRWQ